MSLHFLQTEDAFFDDVPVLPHHTIVRNGEELGQMVRACRESSIFAFDWETDGLEWFRGRRPCGGAFAVWDGTRTRAWYTPCRHIGNWKQLDPEKTEQAWKDILEDPHPEKIAHNLKFELHMAYRIGIQVAGTVHDTMIAAHLYDETIPVGLKSRAAYHLNDEHAEVFESAIASEVKRLAKIHRLGVKAFKALYGYATIDPGLVGRYACHDPDMTLRLFKHLMDAGDIPLPLYQDEVDLVTVLREAEWTGLPVDTDYLEWVYHYADKAAHDAEDAFFQATGLARFDLASNEQVTAAIQQMNVPLTRKTRKSGEYQVDQKTLAEFVPDYPWLKHLFTYRDTQKIKGTYSRGLAAKAVNGVLHGNLKQLGTVTGRLSSNEPNLQNIPSSPKPPEGQRYHPLDVRQAFLIQRTPEQAARVGLDGERLYRVMIDYSQIELRVLAHYSQDERMLKTYRADGDIHEEVENAIFGTGRTTEHGEQNRRFAKVINFGLAYGLTGQGYARQIGRSLEEGERVFGEFGRKFPGVMNFKASLFAYASQHGGTIENMFGRRRHVPQICSLDKWERLRAERELISSLIQGTAAELTKKTMVRTWRMLKQRGYRARLVTTIHDEWQLDVPESEVGQLTHECIAIAENYPEFALPIKVGVKVTHTTWSDVDSRKVIE